MKTITLNNLTIFLLFPFLSAGYVPAIYAQQAGEQQWDIKAGAMVTSYSTPWVGGEHQNDPFPFFDARYENWHIGGERLLSYQAVEDEQWELVVGLDYRDDGYQSDFGDHPLFSGYDSPDAEVIAHLGISYGILSMQATQDVSDNSESSTLSMLLKYPLYKNRSGLMLDVSAAAHWYSDDYVNYYFGVEGNQVNDAVGRSAYQGDAAVNYELGVNAMYPLNKQWILIGSLSRTKLDDEIVDSPLIEEDYQEIARLILAYRF